MASTLVDDGWTTVAHRHRRPPAGSIVRVAADDEEEMTALELHVLRTVERERAGVTARRLARLLEATTEDVYAALWDGRATKYLYSVGRRPRVWHRVRA